MNQEADIPIATYDRWAILRPKIDLARTLVSYAGTQLLVQLIGLVAGFLIIRSLPKESYAIYILAATGIGLLSVLSDSGITSATMSLIGAGRHDRVLVTKNLLAARRLRWRFFAVASLALLPLFVRLAGTETTGYTAAAIYCAIVLLVALYQLDYAVTTIVPKLHQDLFPFQRLELVANGVRLGAVVMLALQLPSAALFLLTSLLSAFLLARGGDRLIASELVDNVEPSADETQQIWHRARPQIPNTVFYCFFGQASLIVIAILGGDAQVAEVGALGRLSALFAVATATMAAVVVPRFSRIAEPRLLQLRYLQTIAFQVAISGLLLLIATMFPQFLLLILGDQYAGLTHVVKWSVLAALIHSLAGTVWQLNAARPR